MTKHTYRFSVRGEAADLQTWMVEDLVTCETSKLWDAIMQQVWHRLTRGQAVYGRPGVGCNGPYQLTHLEIDREPVVVPFASKGERREQAG